MKKQKSPAPDEEARLGDLVLPDKTKVGKILSSLDLYVNRDEFDLVLGPFFDMMRRTEGRMR